MALHGVLLAAGLGVAVGQAGPRCGGFMEGNVLPPRCPCGDDACGWDGRGWACDCPDSGSGAGSSCSERLSGLSAALNDVCCEDDGGSGARGVCAGGMPSRCSYACANLWADFASDCPSVVSSLVGFDTFSAQCAATSRRAVALDERGHGTASSQQHVYSMPAVGGGVYELTLVADSAGDHQNEVYSAKHFF